LVGFAGHQQHVVVAPVFQNCRFGQHFYAAKRAPLQLVIQAKPAVGADILALIAQVQRHIQLHGIAEAVAREPVAELRHLLEVGRGSRRNQRLKIVQRAAWCG
jgi:hypothetical protein